MSTPPNQDIHLSCSLPSDHRTKTKKKHPNHPRRRPQPPIMVLCSSRTGQTALQALPAVSDDELFTSSEDISKFPLPKNILLGDSQTSPRKRSSGAQTASADGIAVWKINKVCYSMFYFVTVSKKKTRSSERFFVALAVYPARLREQQISLF